MQMTELDSEMTRLFIDLRFMPIGDIGMDKNTEMLRIAVQDAKIGQSDKMNALRKLDALQA
jgi:hypothetical protein